jgi:hypothetical protein
MQSDIPKRARRAAVSWRVTRPYSMGEFMSWCGVCRSTRRQDELLQCANEGCGRWICKICALTSRTLTCKTCAPVTDEAKERSKEQPPWRQNLTEFQCKTCKVGMDKYNRAPMNMPERCVLCCVFHPE